MMRGLVIVLMALDHTRHFFTNAPFSPTDLSQTSTSYFLTRWITHLCAPTFVFLAGTGAFLSISRRNLTSRQLARYLFNRGIWLIVLEVTLVRFGWTFNWDYSFVFAQVIWALGWSMLCLSALVFLPRSAVAVFSLTVIAGHNALDTLQAVDNPPWNWLWTVLHARGKIEYLTGRTFFISYPLIPWIAVMSAGYCLGPLFLQTPQKRQTALLFLGLACIGLFLLLRLGNFYGDPVPWIPQKNWIFTLLSVLNCAKYPPSLLYLLMTLGLMFVFLRIMENGKILSYGHCLIIFGKVPLFFYVLHLPLIHGAALVATSLKGMPLDSLFTDAVRAAKPLLPSPQYGFDLPMVYAYWVALLVLLYPLCDAFVKIKRRYPHLPWLQYL